MASLVGTSVGDYLVTGYVGSGATAEVYEAVGDGSGQRLAMKVMRTVSSADLAAHLDERFSAEVDVLRQLAGCPYVVQIHDSGRLNDKIPYYVMDLLEGRTLEEALADQRVWSLGEAFPVVRQLCMALQTLHGRRIVHRDLKPGNVILCDNASPSVVLLDFGIAKQLDADRAMTIGAMGSPIFASPEQVRNDAAAIGPGTDIYALGAIMYLMLAGKEPFDIASDADALSVMTMRLRCEPLPLRERAPWIPAPLARMVDSCLATTPSGRPASAMAVLAQFAQALETDPLRGLDCGDCDRKATCPAIPQPAALMPFADTILEIEVPPRCS